MSENAEIRAECSPEDIKEAERLKDLANSYFNSTL